MKLDMEVGLGPGHIVLEIGPSSPLSEGTQLPIFGKCLLWQTAGWIKMPLGTDVGLGRGDIVLDGDPSSPQKGHSPQFSAHVYCGQTVAHLSYC